MPKIHTRRKRMLGQAAHQKGKAGPLQRKRRPKTFASEALAKAHAEKIGLKKYSIERLNFGISKKFKITEKV